MRQHNGGAQYGIGQWPEGKILDEHRRPHSRLISSNSQPPSGPLRAPCLFVPLSSRLHSASTSHTTFPSWIAPSQPSPSLFRRSHCSFFFSSLCYPTIPSLSPTKPLFLLRLQPPYGQPRTAGLGPTTRRRRPPPKIRPRSLRRQPGPFVKVF